MPEREYFSAAEGMAEMTLIKLEEIVDQPQRKRKKMIEKQAGGAAAR